MLTEFLRGSRPALDAGNTVQIGKAQSLPPDIYTLAQRTDIEPLNVKSAPGKHRVPQTDLGCQIRLFRTVWYEGLKRTK